MMHGHLTTFSAPRVYLYCHAVDMRRSFDGLMAIVQAELSRDVRDGELFVFINRRADRLKALWWDGDGLAILPSSSTSIATRFGRGWRISKIFPTTLRRIASEKGGRSSKC